MPEEWWLSVHSYWTLFLNSILEATALVTPSHSGSEIFGFAGFVQALALLVIVYTISDIQHRFRILIAPIPLYPITYIATGIIGLGTLGTDFWFSHQFPTPRILSDQAVCQALFGILFLAVVSLWIWYAFLNPPVFGKWNYKKFSNVLFSYILRGSDAELAMVAAELARSANSLVDISAEIPVRSGPDDMESSKRPGPEEYAYEVFLLIGNRKLCRSMVMNSPGTAIGIFNAMSRLKKYRLPIGQFSTNLTTEAINNSDSILFHEDEGYFSGLFGYVKPFSRSVYGNYDLVESLATHATHSPLDVHYKSFWSWDATRIEAYSRVVLICLEDYARTKWLNQHSYALYRAFNDLKGAPRGLHKLDGESTDYYNSDIYQRLMVVVRFVENAIELLDKHKTDYRTQLRRRDEAHRRGDIYDHLADMVFELIFHASGVTRPVDTCWSVQHNVVWSPFLQKDGGAALKVVQFKVRRLLYDEIVRMEKFANFKSARVLGVCLNVMGLKEHGRKGFDRQQFALQKAVLSWTKRNFMSIYNDLPEVAEASIMGGISFDKDKSCLIKTYAKLLSREAPEDRLYLDK